MRENNFITCKLIGPGEIGGYHNFGLGNQMFQIATALSYAFDNNLEAIFPDLNNPKFGNYKKNIFRNLNTEIYDEYLVDYEYYEPSFSYNKIPPFRNIRIHGYFQSENYFSHNAKLIKKIFDVDKSTKKYILDKYGDIFSNTTSCHFRFGDYRQLVDKHPILANTDYYQNSLEIIGNTNLLIFSDDIDACKKIDILKKPGVQFISGESDFIDLYMMSMCQNNIIANSTFSWWSAWLNDSSVKKVLYPEFWFGEDKQFSTDDLIPNDWTQVRC